VAGPDDARQSLCSVLVDGAGSRVLSPPRTAPSRPPVRIREPPAGRFRSADGRRCESPGPSRLTIGKRHTQDFVVGVRLQLSRVPVAGSATGTVRTTGHADERAQASLRATARSGQGL
jgi:hypothetical protein